MAAIQFYHLTATPLERALPKLLEKAYEAGFRALVIAESDARMEQLNQILWTFSTASFLPHGSINEANMADQPVLLSTHFANENNADVLVITNGQAVENAQDYKRVLDIFDGNNKSAVEAARARWSDYKNSGAEIAYFKQTDAGGWEKAA